MKFVINGYEKSIINEKMGQTIKSRDLNKQLNLLISHIQLQFPFSELIICKRNTQKSKKKGECCRTVNAK